MRVAFIHLTSRRFGDHMRAQNIAKFLRASGFELSEISPDSSILRRSWIKIGFHGLPWVLNDVKLRASTPKGALTQFKLVSLKHFLHKVCTKIKPDIIFAETSIAGWAALDASKRLSIPCVVDVHGLVGAEYRGEEKKHWKMLYQLEAETFENSDHLIAVSKNMREYIVKNHHISRDKITVVYNGADSRVTFAKFDLPLKVIYAGIFSYWEKLHDYLEVATQIDINRFRFFLMGDGPLRKKILEKIKEDKIPVHYLGYKPRREALNVMTNMQVGLAPSTLDIVRAVAFPIKVLDYMACGLPVIAPRIGEWGEMIESENCGVALRKDNIDQYLSALETLKDEQIWLQKSKNAMSVITRKFLWEKTLTPIKTLLYSLVRRCPTSLKTKSSTTSFSYR